jgi:tRNA A58 N-methylase Trm61
MDMNQHSGWYYDEFKQIGIDYTNLEEVQAYDLRMRRLRNIESESASVIDLLGIKNTDLILEIGTGTGELALGFSVHCRKDRPSKNLHRGALSTTELHGDLITFAASIVHG